MKTKEEWLNWLKQIPDWPFVKGYRVDENACLGLGATAIAFKARKQGEQVDVCLKFLDTGASGSTGEAARNAAYHHQDKWRSRGFVKDLSDPLTVELPAGAHCTAIPFPLAQSNLEDWCKKGPLPPSEFLDLADSLTAALAEVRERGFVLRDLKPANVGVYDKDPRFQILDLGSISSKDKQERSDHTPWFVAPERIEGKKATELSDIYELGGTLLCALGGGPGFSAGPDQPLRTPCNQVGDVLAKLANVPDWQTAFEDPETAKELTSFLEELLAEKPEDRPHRTQDVRRSVRHLSALLDRARRFRVQFAWIGAALLVVCASVLSVWWIVQPSPNPDDHETGREIALPRWSDPVASFDRDKRHWMVTVSGVDKSGEIIFQGRKGTGNFIVKEVIEQRPGEFLVPPDLWAGVYVLSWKTHPDKWQKQVPISPEISQVTVPIRADDGTFRAAISTQIVVTVLGCNLDERNSVRVDGLGAVPLSEKDNGRWEPTAMTYLFTCPPEPGLHELVLELGSEQLWKGTIEFFSEALESVLRMSAQPFPFEQWMQLLANPSQAQNALQAIEKLTDWNEQLQRRLTQLTGEKLRLPDKVATALAEQLERVESAQFNRRLFLAKSSKCNYREIYEATCKDLQAVADLRATLIAVSDAGEPLKEFVARRAKDSKETREYLSRLIGAVGPAFAALPVATTIRARLDDLLAKQCIWDALKISEDAVVEKRREKLSTAITKGWMKFTLGISVLDSKGQLKPISAAGKEEPGRLDLSGVLTLKDVRGTEYVYMDLRMPDGRNDKPARWELGDTVKIVLILSYNIPLVDWDWAKDLPGAKTFESSSEGTELQGALWYGPQSTDPPGNTLVLFLREDWPDQAFKPVFSPSEEVTRRERLAPEALGRLKEPHLFR